MKKALSNLLIGITATNLAQPLCAGPDEEIIAISTLPVKQREFKYTFEVMKMICAMRVVVNPEDPGDPLVDAVSDQLREVAPFLISGIHTPSDTTYLLGSVFKTDSADGYEIIKQALYKAAGLELPKKAPSLAVEEIAVEAVVETHKPLHTTEAVVVKKREFEYVIERMKMQHCLRIAVPLEGSLVDAVRDQILEAAPFLISYIHSPDDVTRLLGREVRTESEDGYEILKQALYKAAGLELSLTAPTVTAPVQPSEVHIIDEEVVTSDISPGEATTPLALIEDSTIVEEIVADSTISLDSTPTVETLDLPSEVLPILEEVRAPQLQTESVSDLEIEAQEEETNLIEVVLNKILSLPSIFKEQLEIEEDIVPQLQTELTSNLGIEAQEEARTTDDKITEKRATALDMLRIEDERAQTQTPATNKMPSKSIEFSIDLHLSQTPGYSPPFTLSEPSEYINKSPKTARIDLRTETNDVIKKVHVFPNLEVKLPVKSKVRLKPKFETQLKPAAVSSILNHLGIAYLAGLMMILMSIMKDAFGLRTRIQIAARPRNHYRVIELSDLPNWTFNLNNTNGNRQLKGKNFQRKSW